MLNSPEKLNEHTEESKTLLVTKVFPFGLFLEDGGFIHISQISDFHKGGRIFAPEELGEWYRVGSSVVVKLAKEEKTLNGEKHLFYDFIGPGNVIDVEGVEDRTE